MVGLVIVSHSRDLAAGLAGLASGVSEKPIPVAHAGGVGENYEELGTDATQIMEAIESVFSEDGVLVLMDLGSAILSAETALEFLGDEYGEKVRICAAPLVEGAVAAAVQISVGADIDTVVSEAMDALLPKRRQLGVDETPTIQTPTTDKTTAASSDTLAPNTTLRSYEIRTEHGLHARPAAKFVETIAGFDAQVKVRNVTKNSDFVNAASLNRVALLSVTRGNTIEVAAAGPDAKKLLAALDELVTENFGEPEASSVRAEPDNGESPRGTGTSPKLRGTPDKERLRNPVGVSEGWAVGALFFLDATEPDVPDHAAPDAEYELDLLDAARTRVRTRLSEQIHALGARGAASEAEILEAHQLILDDPEVLDAVRRSVEESGINAAQAYAYTMQELAHAYASKPDPYLAQRAADIQDVRRAVLCEMLDEGCGSSAGPDSPALLYARELSPSNTAQLDPEMILGIITELGGPTSHAGILARALGIPAVAGYSIDPSTQPTPQSAAIDGRSGTLVLDPDEATIASYSAKREAWLQRRTELRERSGEAAYTRDELHVTVLANIGDLAGANQVGPNGGEGVGLLRTEFLFLSRRKAPSEDEQAEMLTKMFNAVGDKPITVRTLDVGGDKELAYISMPEEENPFLGVRGVRLCLKEYGLYKEHLRAILRAAAGRSVQIMLPMVTRQEEIERSQAILNEAAGELRSEGVELDTQVAPLGIMIETPAAVLHAAQLAKRSAFFSIGTNDLTQYVMAAERGNDSLVDIADPMHPAVLKAVHESVKAADAAGIEISVCGEAAAAPETLVLLIGLGITKLSMNPSAIPAAKDLVRRISYSDSHKLAEYALSCPGAQEVREGVTHFLAEME